jgi:proteasome accessory factor A
VTRTLFGVETEYALFGTDELEQDGAGAAAQLVEAVSRRHPWLRDCTGTGVFLANGARFYLDCGHHPELATPECSSPWELVACVRAGDRLLERALAEIGADEDGSEPSLTRCNVDYGDGGGATWGSHESYLHSSDPDVLARALVPHLVSRIVYAGAGGFDPLSPGIEFTLSPRAGFLLREISKDSTTMRGLVHSKNEALASGGTRRLHLICGESLCSEQALLLRIGATALVVALVESGECPGDAVALADPIAALRAFAGDPSCRVGAALARGGTATALELQGHYLERVEAALAGGRLPEWAPAICARWRAALERLARGPESLATTLDWAIKWALYRRSCAPRRSWEWLEAWTRVLRGFAAALRLDGGAAPCLERLRAADESARGAMARELLPRLRREGLAAGELPAFLRRRAELFEIDFRFAQLGPRGVFARLDRAGRLAHRVVSEARIARAVERAPARGRANARGEEVRRLSGSLASRYVCDWAAIFDRVEERVLELGDPFASRGVWRPESAAADGGAA